MTNNNIQKLLFSTPQIKELEPIVDKILNNERINSTDGILLFEKGELGFLGILANYVREKKNKNIAWFNRNIHIEPTNVCVYNCSFCSFSRKRGDEGAWEYSIEEILNSLETYKEKKLTEIHIVGGVHPEWDLQYYGNLISKIKEILPNVHVKAFTAVELNVMIKRSGLTIREGLIALKEFGLDSIPGGGAEIFNEKIRQQVCESKITSEQWLDIHKEAHNLGIHTNATMLYGHIENYGHRIDHLNRLRELQDETGMFNTFIPLKYRNINNSMSEIGEVSMIEDLKNYAVSRIFLDNFAHLKAYWPMIGKDTSAISLSYGVDDIDGTIDDSTKIYTMAGVKSDENKMTTEALIKLIKSANRTPVERDTLYNVIKSY